MNLDDLPPPELMWEGKFVRALKRGKWEYASRADDINAVVILAEVDGKMILIDQPPNRKSYHQMSAVGRHAAQARTANSGTSAQCSATS